MRFLFKKKPEPTVNSEEVFVFDEHFTSICNALFEVRTFKEKRMVPNVTMKYFKKVDIEDAWPSSKALMGEMFEIVYTIAADFKLNTIYFDADGTFKNAIDAFIELMNSTRFGISEIVNSTRVSARKMKAVDERILQLQHRANRLKKYVLVDFNFPPVVARPLQNSEAHKTAELDSLLNG